MTIDVKYFSSRFQECAHLVYSSFLLRILIESRRAFLCITMANQVMITEDMLKDCDRNFLEGVEITPPVEVKTHVDCVQLLDQIKFLTTKVSERDREIGFLKQDLDRTLDVSYFTSVNYLPYVLFKKYRLFIRLQKENNIYIYQVERNLRFGHSVIL